MLKRPVLTDSPEYYQKYISLVPEVHVLEYLNTLADTTYKFFESISPSMHDFRYAPNKWSIKEIAGHLGDVERVFAYRALRFSRGDKTELPGFEENEYVTKSNFKDLPLKELSDHLYTSRKSTLLLFNSFSKEMWNAVGMANGSALSVLSVPYILAGHEIHHLKIIRERYLFINK